jgi:hypothetical protein
MKLTTLVLSLTACVFAAGYVVFAPRINHDPRSARSESLADKVADTGNTDKVTAVPQPRNEVVIPPDPAARVAKKADDAAVVDQPREEEAAVQKSRRAEVEESEKPAPPTPAAPPPMTANEVSKDASTAPNVPPGHQAVTVERTREVFGGPSAKVVGLRVNVIATARNQGGEPQSKVVLRDVLVLAEDHGTVDKNVRWLTTLAVAEKDLPAIEKARRLGPVTIVPKPSRPELVGPPAPPAPQAPVGPVIVITEAPNLPVIITQSPTGPTINTESSKLPRIIEGPR